jgi:serine/threonine protein kinase
MQAKNNDDLNVLVGKSLGQFRIVERIGAGGMATVFKAYQPTLDRYVAIKVLPAYHARDPIFMKRFVQEAKAVAKLTHANIVTIHEFGEHEGITYIVMEHVEGGTLKDRLKGGRALPIAEVVDFMIQAAEGLHCAHSNGIIHRDVKPANMLLRKDGHLLISDFGIAKMLEGTTNLTRVGTGIGTPQYMSPEQGTGQPVDRRSDIYSLGIVFFHCLTGHVPFNADSPVGITVKHLNEPLPVQQLHVVGIPPLLEQIIVKMTAKSPQDRYQTMDAVVVALKSVLQDSSRSLWPPAASQLNLPVAPDSKGGQGSFPVSREFDFQPQTVMLTCFRCGATNPSNRLYCTTCGYDLSDKPVDLYLGPNGRPMLARLTIQNGQLVGRSYLFHQVMTTIGRTNGNDLIISGRTVSRRHARLWFDNGQWFLQDLGSANGTMVNNMRIFQPMALKDGDIINFGDEVVLFNLA